MADSGSSIRLLADLARVAALASAVNGTSPISRSATITGDTRIPGHHVLTAGYPAASTPTTPLDTNSIRIVLTGLRSSVSVGFSYPVVFAFERPANYPWNCPSGIPPVRDRPPRQSPLEWVDDADRSHVRRD